RLEHAELDHPSGGGALPRSPCMAGDSRTVEDRVAQTKDQATLDQPCDVVRDRVYNIRRPDMLNAMVLPPPGSAGPSATMDAFTPNGLAFDSWRETRLGAQVRQPTS